MSENAEKAAIEKMFYATCYLNPLVHFSFSILSSYVGEEVLVVAEHEFNS